MVEIRLTEAMAAHATDTLDRAMDTISVEKDMAQVVKVRPRTSPRKAING